MKLKNLLKELKEQVKFEEKHKGKCDDFDFKSWGMEEGILITVNQAKLIIRNIG